MMTIYLLGLFYIFAGISHFLNPLFYKKMVAGFLPFPALIVYLSGIVEVVLGMGVFFSETRQVSLVGIILLLIAVFPANINMALHPKEWKIPPYLLYLRLFLQPLLIYWAWVMIR